MKIRGVFCLISLLLLCSLSSCSKDDDGGYAKLANQENTITYKIYSNTQGVPITLQSGLVIKDYWETTFVTKEYSAQIVATSDDPNVLITGEIYVNGKLKARNEKNSSLRITYQIKGKGY